MADSGKTGRNEAVRGKAGGKDVDELARHPGRRRGTDEIDPELVRLPRPRARISPVLAASVVVFCLYLAGRLWSDLSFSRQGDEPTPLAAAEVVDAERNQFVEVRAAPEAAHLYRITRGSAELGHRAAPALGSQGSLWILVDGSAWGGEPIADQRYRGRLYTLGEMPFYDELRAAVQSAPPVPRPVAPDVLKQALESRAAAVRALGGEDVALSGDTGVVIEQTVGDRALVTAAATDAYDDEASWRAALVRAGVVEPGRGPITSTELSWTYEVAAPEGVAGVQAELAAAQLYAALAHPLVREHRAPWSDVELHGAELVVGDTALDWSDVSAAAVDDRPTVPADAAVVVTTERPAGYWYLVPVYALLLVFAGLFGWALWRGVRPARA